jgi:methionine-rich copper-binding protein CopC
MRPTRLLLVPATAAVLATAVPALAADPSSGTVSAATPTASWSGDVIGPVWTFASIVQPDDTFCAPPSCDTYTLTVADGPADLTVAATSEDSSITTLYVKKPDGSGVFADGIDPEASPNPTTTVKVKKAVNGTYTVNVGVDTATTGSYGGLASLAVPGAAPAPANPVTPPSVTPPASSPAPAPASASLTTKAPKLSARKLKKGKKVAFTVSTTKPVTDLVAQLRKGSTVVGTGKLASLGGSGKVSVKLAKKLKKGTYTLALTAKDGASTVGATVPVKVTK